MAEQGNEYTTIKNEHREPFLVYVLKHLYPGKSDEEINTIKNILFQRYTEIAKDPKMEGVTTIWCEVHGVGDPARAEGEKTYRPLHVPCDTLISRLGRPAWGLFKCDDASALITRSFGHLPLERQLHEHSLFSGNTRDPLNDVVHLIDFIKKDESRQLNANYNFVFDGSDRSLKIIFAIHFHDRNWSISYLTTNLIGGRLREIFNGKVVHSWARGGGLVDITTETLIILTHTIFNSKAIFIFVANCMEHHHDNFELQAGRMEQTAFQTFIQTSLCAGQSFYEYIKRTQQIQEQFSITPYVKQWQESEPEGSIEPSYKADVTINKQYAGILDRMIRNNQHGRNPCPEYVPPDEIYFKTLAILAGYKGEAVAAEAAGAAPKTSYYRPPTREDRLRRSRRSRSRERDRSRSRERYRSRSRPRDRSGGGRKSKKKRRKYKKTKKRKRSRK